MRRGGQSHWAAQDKPLRGAESISPLINQETLPPAPPSAAGDGHRPFRGGSELHKPLSISAQEAKVRRFTAEGAGHGL